MILVLIKPKQKLDVGLTIPHLRSRWPAQVAARL